MKLTVQHVMDATLVITRIIQEQRRLPQKGKYRLARMHSKLLPEFTLIHQRRDDMIKAYGTPKMEPVTGGEPGEMRATEDFVVPLDKMTEFTAAWGEIASEQIEIDVEPIPLSQLDLGDDVEGSIESTELIALGDLVVES